MIAAQHAVFGLGHGVFGTVLEAFIGLNAQICSPALIHADSRGRAIRARLPILSCIAAHLSVGALIIDAPNHGPM
jgi:hypothetical protein